MKLFLANVLSFIFLLLPTSFANSGVEVIDQLNFELNRIDNQKGFQCHGLRMVKSCGNWKCEPKKGENENTCPADCVKADIRSYNSQTLCHEVQRIFRPDSIDRVQHAVKFARENGLKVRVVGQMHSANEQLCTGGVAITTEHLNRIHGIEKFEGQETVNVEGGVILGDLTEWLHTHNRSIGFNIMGFRGVSIAGATATGSHGSSPKHTSVISNIVQSMRVVDSFGKLREYSRKTTDEKTWKALTTSMGMLGVIVDLRLRIQPQFNLDVAVTYHADSELLKPNAVMNLVKECDWGQLNWFPGSKKFVKSCGRKTTQKADAGATNSLLDPIISKSLVKPVKQILQLGACHNRVACMMERVRLWQFKFQPPFKKLNKRGKLKPSHRVIGPSHRMQSSFLTSHQEGFFQMDWEIVVPASKAQAALEKIYEHLKSQKVCLPLVGVFIRYGISEDQSLMAHTASGNGFKKGEPVVFLEIPVYLPTAFPQGRKQSYDSPYEEFARMLVRDFNGRGHWGKNREWLFKYQGQLNSYGEKLDAFQEVVNKMDPQGMFTNKFAKAMGLNAAENLNLSAAIYNPCSQVDSPVCVKNKKYLNQCYAAMAGFSRKDYKNCEI